ncbi:hypothetical protein YC2023_050766 [Brassica napus]
MSYIESIHVGMKNQSMRNFLFATSLALSTKNQIRLLWFQKINSGQICFITRNPPFVQSSSSPLHLLFFNIKFSFFTFSEPPLERSGNQPRLFLPIYNLRLDRFHILCLGNLRKGSFLPEKNQTYILLSEGENFTDAVGSPFSVPAEVLTKDYDPESLIWSDDLNATLAPASVWDSGAVELDEYGNAKLWVEDYGGDDTVGWVLGCLGEFNKEGTSPITHVDIITLCQGVLPVIEQSLLTKEHNEVFEYPQVINVMNRGKTSSNYKGTKPKLESEWTLSGKSKMARGRLKKQKEKLSKIKIFKH